MFKTPDDPFIEPMTMPPVAEMLPEFATVRLPMPDDPIVNELLLLKSELLPVIRMLLLEESPSRPITVPYLLPWTITVPPLEMTSELAEPSTPTMRSAELLQRELVPIT